jgi:hypothetical protein
MFLKPNDLENMRAKGPISLVANTRLDIVPKSQHVVGKPQVGFI